MLQVLQKTFLLAVDFCVNMHFLVDWQVFLCEIEIIKTLTFCYDAAT